MKPRWIVKLYAVILLVIFGGIVLHAPLSVGFGTVLPDFELLIKSWKEALLLLAGVMAIVIVWHRDLWQEILSDRIIQVALLYIALHVMTAAAFLTGSLATLAGLAIDLRYVIFFVLVYICIKAAPEYKRSFLRVGVVGAVIVIGFGVLQLFLPADILKHIGYGENTIQPYLTVDENPDYVRINSTLRGPNPLGAYVAIVLGVLAAAVIRGKLRIRERRELARVGVAVLASLAVLWATYSRSAIIAAGVAVFAVMTIAGRQFISRRVWIAGCVIVCALAGGIILGRDHSFVTNVVLHENREGGSETTSNDGHFQSLLIGTERLLRQPVGAGIGSTGSASLFSDDPLILENQYLFIAHEVGWLGLGLFVTLVFLILRRLWLRRSDWLSLGAFASGVGISCIGFLQPVWADDTVSIIWWSLAALAIAAGGQHVRRTTKQKTT